MKYAAPLLLVTLMCSLAGCSADAPQLPTSPLLQQSASQGILPAGMTANERTGKADGWDPRDDQPESYGYTEAPAGDVRLPGEFEPVSRVLMGWGAGAWDYEGFMLATAVAAAEQAKVTILVPSQYAANTLQADLESAEAKLENIELLAANLDTIWIRDYGPMAVEADARTYIDARYYWGRWQDDYVPTALASHFELPVSRPPLDFEGGNLLSDGAGRCLTTDMLYRNNLAREYDEEDLKDVLKRYYGCTETLIVPALRGEPTGHVDLSVHITARDEAIVGEYKPEQDEVNAERLDRTAEILTDAGFTVRRVPMPDNDGGWVFRSYTNALAVNDSVLVPVYYTHDETMEEGLAVFREAYPDREIVPIASDDIIYQAGAVHCVTMSEAL